MIGNPPFGKNASLAVAFFNHAARQSDVIAMILPRFFRKASVENQRDAAFHLLLEEPVPDRAFLFDGKPFDAATVFQIWERRSSSRELKHLQTCHADFEFTEPARANFAIQRVGARAGRVHHDLTRSPSAHYFIRGDVEQIMRQLDFASVVGNVASNPSLSEAKIIDFYSEFTSRRATSNPRRLGVQPCAKSVPVNTLTPAGTCTSEPPVAFFVIDVGGSTHQAELATGAALNRCHHLGSLPMHRASRNALCYSAREIADQLTA